MKKYLTLFLLIPTPLFAAGGFVALDWLMYVDILFLVSFPFTFFYVGYLCFKAYKRSFIWSYILALCFLSIAVLTTSFLTTHENTAWLEYVCVLSWVLVPVLIGLISYKIDVVTEEKYEKLLRFCWKWIFASLIVIISQPFLFGLLEYVAWKLQ